MVNGKIPKNTNRPTWSRAPSGTIGRLEQIRIKHQNAYKKWTPEEEVEIVSQFKNGKSIKNISALSVLTSWGHSCTAYKIRSYGKLKLKSYNFQNYRILKKQKDYKLKTKYHRFKCSK